MGDSGSSILQAGAGLFWLSMVLHVITLPCGYGVGAISFAYSGFKSTDVYIVPGSPWTYNSTTGAFYLAYLTGDYDTEWFTTSDSGRFLYPQLVQIKDPTTMAVKSFSTSFIFQIFIENTSLLTPGTTGPGLAYLMVPDNVTIGGNLDYMGLITANTTETSPNLQSDDHTLGVEFDTYLNEEFGDPNNNHVGLDLTSMNSSSVFVPSLIMASEDAEVMRQVWIDYDQSDARVDIYISPYGQGKPATPEGSTQGVDLSFLLEEMYVGFSSAVGIESNNLHTVLAWSFSNEGEAPPISIQRDAPTSPGTSPPQGAPPPSIFSPPPPPIFSSPPPPSSLSPSPPSSPQPSVFVPLPGPAPQGVVPSPSSSDPSAAPLPGHSKKLVIIEASVGSFLGLIIFLGIGIFCWWKFFRRPRPAPTPPLIVGLNQESVPLHIFVSHTGGPTGHEKNFAIRLSDALSKSSASFDVFIDREMDKTTYFPDLLFEKIEKTDLGIVIVSEEFFKKKWPMVELMKFVELYEQHKPPKVLVLPLFYKLTTEDVRNHLQNGFWEDWWKKISTQRHPIDLQKCREAVQTLCNIYGVNYIYRDESHEKEYIADILKEVKMIYDKMQRNPLGEAGPSSSSLP